MGEILFRFGLLAVVRVGTAPTVIRHGKFRIEPDGLVEVGNRLVVVALVEIRDAPAVTRPQTNVGSSRMAPRLSRQ